MFGWSRSPVTTASDRNFSRRSASPATLLADHLDRDQAIDRGLPRGVHHAHAAVADHLEQFVVGAAPPNWAEVRGVAHAARIDDQRRSEAGVVSRP